jgi:hypothetical protein
MKKGRDIVDRVNIYGKKTFIQNSFLIGELPDINVTLKDKKEKAYGIQKFFEDFNTKLKTDQNWGQPGYIEMN